MKKRVLSMLMTLALCLTLLPTPAWAAEDTPEGGAIVQQEQQEEISPAVSEQAGTNEEENGSEGDPQNTGTPDAGGAEDSKADAPESGENENAGNNADSAVSAVQTMIDALPAVSELDGMTADELDAAYDDIQAAYNAYEALNAEQQAQINGADFEALLGWFNSQTAPLADAQPGVHTHCVCGKDSSTTVNGHTHNTGTTWTATDALPSTAGSYYLTQSVTADWTVPTGEVNLCLNGQTINGKITVGSGATLTLTDCSGNGKVQGEVTVNGGKFELYSGTITGGVQVGIKGGTYQTGSSFTMYGGAITGNEDYGGVFLVGTTNHIDPPSFTMHGGTISDNTAGASDGGGGGVYVGEKCSFTMDGGTITGNTATAGNGGGIYIHFNAGNVSISNATITGNKASATGDTRYGHGGGIYSERGVTVKNVTITGNNSTYEGGGIYGKGAITLTDATVTDNNHYDVYYGGQESSAPELTVSGLVKAGYYANNDWKLPILVSGELSEDSVIRVGVYDGIKPAYGSQLTIAEPASGVTLRAENFEADAADYVTSLGDDGKVYLSPCEHEMDDTGYTCKKCHTQFDARIGESAYYQTLAKAFLNAWNGSTITLMRDVNLNGNCSTSDTITLDLHGKTITSEDKPIRVNEKLTVKDSSESGGTQALNVKFLVASNGTLAVDDSYTGDISCVELWPGGALEAYTGTIQELLLGKEGNGTGYSVKLWKGNTSACTIGKITDGTTSKSLTVKDLLKTNHAKCELYGEKGGTWSIIDKSTKIVDLTDYKAYKVQFAECVHQCDDDTNPVCSKCGKALVVKITATASDDKIKTAWFPADSGIENGDGYVEAIQTLNGWSAEGYTDATLMPLCDVHNNTGGIGIASVTLTGKLTVDGGEHLIYSTTIAAGADVTFKTGRFYYITVNGKASFVGGTYLGGVTASSGAEAVFSGGAYQYLDVEDGGTAVVKNTAAFDEDVTVTKGTLTVEGGSFKAAVVVEGDGTMNVNGGSFTGTGRLDRVTYSGGAKGTISGGSFADLYLYSSGTAWLAGGSFTKLSTGSSGVLSSLLADGAAYYDQRGSAISGSAVSELNDVTVKTHAHTVDAQTGICSVCKKQMAASLTADNETSWYLTLDAAIAAANEADGEKTIKLYQDVPTTAPSYELTRGPVTLDVNGKKALGTFTVKGIQLTVTGTGTIRDVTASGSSAVVKNSTVNINYIEAESGGRLELGGGSYFGLTVINDGSSASLSGGTYKKIDWGKSYVPANEYLADGYGYKTSDGTWEDGTASVDDVTVMPAPIKSTKVYPNSETDYSGSTFDAKNSTSVTLTVSVTSDESAGLTYTWYRSINDEWRSLTNPYITQGLTEKYTGADSQTLSITELPAGQTFSYKVQIATGDGYKCYSEPFTVTRHQHSWTYTASGATITASCTDTTCTSPNGGSVTIKAPAELTYSGEAKPATVTASSDWQGPAASGITISYTKMGMYGPEALENGALPTKAGEYTASITLGEATASVTYTIGKATPKAEDFTFTAPTSLTYDGNVKSATVSPAKTGTGDVIVKYYDKDGKEATPKNAGEYTVKIDVAEGTNYAAAKGLTADSWKFSITKATVPKNNPIGTLNITNGTCQTYTYGFNNILPALPKGNYGTISYGKADISLDSPSEYNYDASTAVSDRGVLTLAKFSAKDGKMTGRIGTVKVNVTTTNYAEFQLTLVLYAVDQIKPTPDGEITAAEITYGDALSKSTISGKMKDPNTGDAVKGTFTWTDGTIKPAANDSYEAEWTFTPDSEEYATVTGKTTVKVAPKSIEGAKVTLEADSFVYDGNKKTPVVKSVVLDNVTLTSLTDYGYIVVKMSNVGIYNFTITGDGNYTGEVKATWQITAREVTPAIEVASCSYTGDALEPNVTVKDDLGNTIDPKEYEIFFSNNTNAGTGRVTIKDVAGGNYVIKEKTQDFTITKAAAPTNIPSGTLNIINGTKQTYTYDFSKLLPELSEGEYGTISYGNRAAISVVPQSGYYYDQTIVEFKNGVLTLAQFSAEEGTMTGQIGTAKVTVTTTNYENFQLTLVLNAVDQIKPKPDGTITATEITYGDELSASTITGTMQDPITHNAVSGTFTWDKPAEKLKVGSYNPTWTFTPDESYGGKYTTYTDTATVKVSPKAVTVSGITAKDKVYDGNTDAVLDYSEVTLDGVLENDTLTVTATGTFESANAGVRKVKISGLELSGDSANNYVPSTVDSQTETTATITAKEVTVTPDNKSKVYEENDPKLTYKVSGVLDGETLKGITLARAEGENAGEYDITGTADAGANPNYNVTFAKGTFTIKPKSIQSATVVLGKGLAANGAEQTQTVAKVLLVNKELPADSYTVSGNTATAHGVYTLTITGKGNYKDFVKWTYVIAPAKAEDAPGEDITIGSGKVKVDVQSEGTVPPATLLTDKAELLAMLVNSGDITADELVQIANGASVDIVLTVKEANVSDEVKTAMAQAAKGYTIGQYLDISLFKYMTVNGSQQACVALHTTKDALTISVVVPDALINTNSAVNRTYCIVRNHKGTMDVLDTAFDAASKTLTFKSDRFSIYAIAYKDTAVPSSGGNLGSNNNSNDSETKKNEVAAPTPAPTPASTSKPSTITAMPQTGDTSNPMLYVVLLVASLLGLAVVFVCKKRNDK